MAQEHVVIPEKIYFKIGEVCELVGVQPHVLRYWETEFSMLSPQKNKSGQRSYRRRDVEIALRIKQLLYQEMFTIAGARKKLQAEQRDGGIRKPAVLEPPVQTEPEKPASVSEPIPQAAPEPQAASTPAPAPMKQTASPSTRANELASPIKRVPNAPTLFGDIFLDDPATEPAGQKAAGNGTTKKPDLVVETRDVSSDVLKTVASHLLEIRELLQTNRFR